MVEPGFRRITLSPRLWGLYAADVTCPTPFGPIRVVQKAGEAPQITVPEEIPYEIV